MTNWQNRIVEYGTADPAELLKLANPLNPRRHPDEQTAAVEGSLNEVGWVQDVVVNRATGRMLDGHLRVKSAVKTGQQTVPVKYVDLTEAEEALVLATLDYTTGLAEFDDDIMKSLLAQLDTDEPGLRAMLEDMREEFGVNSAGEGEGGDTEPEIDKAEELRQKWGVEPGQLWQLGDHRLICGDCTDPATVARVMAGEQAALVFTDPPYDGELGGAGFNKTPDVKMRVNRMQSSINHLYSFNPSDIFSVCERNTVTPSAWFFFCNKKLVPEYINYALNSNRGFDLLLWHKPNFLPMAGSHYFPDTEYLVKIRDKSATFNNGIPKDVVNYGTYWVIESQKGDKKEAEHPTIKPIKIICDQVNICSNNGEIVLDPFSGSGTTIIACENLNRRCRAIEISPAYVGVTLQRFFDHTGIQPVLLSE